jgi:hypothetical protein
VLAETYPRFTVVDRDVMPAIGQHRRGVPQSRHLHVLHPLVPEHDIVGLIATDDRRRVTGVRLAPTAPPHPPRRCPPIW